MTGFVSVIIVEVSRVLHPKELNFLTEHCDRPEYKVFSTDLRTDMQRMMEQPDICIDKTGTASYRTYVKWQYRVEVSSEKTSTYIHEIEKKIGSSIAGEMVPIKFPLSIHWNLESSNKKHSVLFGIQKIALGSKSKRVNTSAGRSSFFGENEWQ